MFRGIFCSDEMVCIDTISHLKIYKVKTDEMRKHKAVIVLGKYNTHLHTHLHNLFLFMCMCVFV